MGNDEATPSTESNESKAPPLPVIIKKNGAILWGAGNKNPWRDGYYKSSCLILPQKPRINPCSTYLPVRTTLLNRQRNFVSRFPVLTYPHYGYNSYYSPDNLLIFHGSHYISRFLYVPEKRNGIASSTLNQIWYESSDSTLLYHRFLKCPRFETIKVPSLVENRAWAPENSRNELPQGKDETEEEYKQRLKNNAGKEELLTLGFEEESLPVFYCDCTEEWDLTAKNFDMSGNGTKEHPWKNFMFAILTLGDFFYTAFHYGDYPKICIKIKGNAVCPSDGIVRTKILQCLKKSLGFLESYMTSLKWIDIIKNMYLTSWGEEPFSLKFINDKSINFNFRNCIFENANISCMDTSLKENPNIMGTFNTVSLFYKCTVKNFFAHGLSMNICESTLSPNTSWEQHGYNSFSRIKNCKIVLPEADVIAGLYSQLTIDSRHADGLDIDTPKSPPYIVRVNALNINNLNAAKTDQAILAIVCDSIANSLYSVVSKLFMPWMYYYYYGRYLPYAYLGHAIQCGYMYNVKIDVSGAPCDYDTGLRLQGFEIYCKGIIERCTIKCACDEVMENVPMFPYNSTQARNWWSKIDRYIDYPVFGIKSVLIVDSTIELSTKFNVGKVKKVGDNCNRSSSSPCAVCNDIYAIPNIEIINSIEAYTIKNSKITNNVSSSLNAGAWISAYVTDNNDANTCEINATSGCWFAYGGSRGRSSWNHGLWQPVGQGSLPIGAVCNVSVTDKSIPWCEVNNSLILSGYKTRFVKDNWEYGVYQKDWQSWTVPSQDEINAHCKYLTELYGKK